MKIELVGTGAIYTKYNGACTLINEDTIVDMPNGTLRNVAGSGTMYQFVPGHLPHSALMKAAAICRKHRHVL